jgi:hypothetical protein
MSFKIRRCKGPSGLPLIEIPDEGLVAERLSPGEIREADFYDLFRRVTRKQARLLVACPKDKVRGGRCTVPLRVLRVWHDRKDLPRLLRECRDGSLARRRQRSISTILRDVRERGGPSFEGVFHSLESVGTFIGRVAVAFLIVLVGARLLSPSL